MAFTWIKREELGIHSSSQVFLFPPYTCKWFAGRVLSIFVTVLFVNISIVKFSLSLPVRKWEEQKTGTALSCCLLQHKHLCSERHQYCNLADCMAVQIQGLAQGKCHYRWDRPNFCSSSVCLFWWEVFKKIQTQSYPCLSLLLTFEAQVWKVFFFEAVQ